MRTALLLILLAFVAGCGSQPEPPTASESTTASEPAAEAPAEDEHAHEGHDHSAPHGGTLVSIGDHFAHLEIVLDSEAGAMTAYFLDSEAENAVQVSMRNLMMMITIDGTPSPLILQGQENALTGETKDNTSVYKVEFPKLQGLERFEAAIPALQIKGQVFENIKFSFPEGNEKT